MHSLLGVLRFCQLGGWVGSCVRGGVVVVAVRQIVGSGVAPPLHSRYARPACPRGAGSEGEPALLGSEGQQLLHECLELDYMTHIVMRMFENTKCVWVGWVGGVGG